MKKGTKEWSPKETDWGKIRKRIKREKKAKARKNSKLSRGKEERKEWMKKKSKNNYTTTTTIRKEGEWKTKGKEEGKGGI